MPLRSAWVCHSSYVQQRASDCLDNVGDTIFLRRDPTFDPATRCGHDGVDAASRDVVDVAGSGHRQRELLLQPGPSIRFRWRSEALRSRSTRLLSSLRRLSFTTCAGSSSSLALYPSPISATSHSSTNASCTRNNDTHEFRLALVIAKYSCFVVNIKNQTNYETLVHVYTKRCCNSKDVVLCTHSTCVKHTHTHMSTMQRCVHSQKSLKRSYPCHCPKSSDIPFCEIQEADEASIRIVGSVICMTRAQAA